MYEIPLMRLGRAYESVEKVELRHHATGEPVARVSLANSGLISRDLGTVRDDVLEPFALRDLAGMCREAATHFLGGSLPCGGDTQSFDEYIRCLSATTGMPQTYCRNNAKKIHKVMSEIEDVIAGLTRGLDPDVLDRGFGLRNGRMLSFFRAGRTFGAVLPSNSPGVHSLWIPAIALKAPVILKPGREEPWTPLRILEAFAAAGVPREALGFYPTDHAGAAEILRRTDRSMLFGDQRTTAPYANDPHVELHGPGYSKVVLGPDVADRWQAHVELIASSIAANGGRSCINASSVWTPRHGREIAAALAEKLAPVAALPADDPRAEIAAFANPAVAEAISATIDAGLREDGAADVTREKRGTPRLVRRGRVAWLLPTIIRCDDRDHPLAEREFLFPFASVVECPAEEMPRAIGPSLVVSAITGDDAFARALMNSPNVDRLNIGAVPTWQISWDQPHEGNLFELLYRQRAFQREAVA